MSFFAGVDRELCEHTPPLLFFIVGELLWSACDACVVSLFGQSVPEVPYARSSPARTWNSAFPFLARPTRPLLLWLARWTRPLARARSRPQCRDAGCVLCTSRQYVDMIAHSPPSRSFRPCPFLLPPALWLHRKTRCGCCWGETELAC